jgi:putative transposase
VQDTYSRLIVGWSLADHMRAELVVETLQMSVIRAGRRYAGQDVPG